MAIPLTPRGKAAKCRTLIFGAVALTPIAAVSQTRVPVSLDVPKRPA